MLLIGYNRSPFVRRVAATLNLYGIPFEQMPLRARDQGAEIAHYNPLGRVPALVLDDGSGETLVDSAAILEHLDEVVGPARALTPPRGAERRAVLRCVMLALGASEKAVTAFAEKNLRPVDKVWPERAERLLGQVRGGFGALDSTLAAHGAEWLVGGRMTQADVTAAVALDYADAAIPEASAEGRFPRLAALRDRVDAIEAVRRTYPAPV